MLSAEEITLGEFNEALARYPALIKSLTKPSKPGVLTLEELDKFRYHDAIVAFSKKAGNKTLELADVQKLVDWKLRHGTFRPTLPKLVASNSNELIKEATRNAFTLYDQSPTNIEGVVKMLSGPLKGIGPATASLILAVHDPDQIIFFSDEVYRWLVHGGEKASPKYNLKEFDDLFIKAKALVNRLSVSALAVEKVAYVLIKESEPPKEAKAPVEKGPPKPRGRPKKLESEKKQKPTLPPKPRGRPRKVVDESAPKTPTGKKRGRPPTVTKEQLTDKSASKTLAKNAQDETEEEIPGRRTKKAKV